MKLRSLALIALLTTLPHVPLCAKKKDKPYISANMRGVVETALSASYLAGAGIIGHTIWRLNLNDCWKNPGIGPSRQYLSAAYATMAVLGYNATDMAYAGFKSFNENKKKEKKTNASAKDTAAKSIKLKEKDQKPLSNAMKAMHSVSGTAQFVLAGACLLPAAMHFWFHYRYLNGINSAEAIYNGISRSDKMRLSLLTKGMYFSAVAGACAWASTIYKIGRSGKTSFTKAVDIPQEHFEEEEESTTEIDESDEE